MEIVKTIYEAEQIPTGYAIVRYDFDCLGYKVAPLGIHWLVRLYNWLRIYPQTEYDRDIRRAYIAGKKDGEKKAAKEWNQIVGKAILNERRNND